MFTLEKNHEELKINSEATIDFLKQKLLNDLGRSTLSENSIEAGAFEQTS